MTAIRVVDNLQVLSSGSFVGYAEQLDFIGAVVTAVTGSTIRVEFTPDLLVMNANCLSTDSVGDIVCISGDSINGVIQVTKADVTSWIKLPGIGIIVSKSSSIDCTVARQGLLSGWESLMPGRMYFVGADSKPSPIPPAATLSANVFVQPIGVAFDSTRLMVNPSLNLTKVIP